MNADKLAKMPILKIINACDIHGKKIMQHSFQGHEMGLIKKHIALQKECQRICETAMAQQRAEVKL